MWCIGKIYISKETREHLESAVWIKQQLQLGGNIVGCPVATLTLQTST